MLAATSALVGATTTHPDWIARGIAAAGVLMALFTLISTRNLWRKQGPLLAFELTVRVFRHPGTSVVHRVQARIEVFNIGRMAATVRAVELRGPWSKSFVATDMTAGGFPVLAPTEFELFNAVDFTAPDDIVLAALALNLPIVPPHEDVNIREEMKVRGRVRRGDGQLFTSARRLTIVYEEQPWPGLASPK